MMRNTMSFVKLATFRVNCFWLEWKHIFLEIWPVFTPKVLFLHTQVCSELNPCYFLMKFFLDGWDGSPQIPSKLTTRSMREVISSRMHVCHNSFTFWQRAPLPLPCSDVGSKVIKHSDTRARVSNFSTRTGTRKRVRNPQFFRILQRASWLLFTNANPNQAPQMSLKEAKPR